MECPAAATAAATATADCNLCRTCQYTFLDRQDQVLHYKLDWHLYNIKQALRSHALLTEEEFNAKCGEGENDLSSLSGSDTDTTDEREEPVVSQFLADVPELTIAAISSPHVVLNTGLSFSKCFCNLLFHPKEDLNDEKLSTSFSAIFKEEKSNNFRFCGRVGIFLYSAQHFAGAVYEADALLLHKTYHRYTVRAKQGTVQGVRDGKGNAPKSLGSSLRRYNQIALFNDVEQLLQDWGPDLHKCNVIFHRTAAYNKPVFDKLKERFLRNSDSDKIRTIPITTYRPTLKETKRVYSILTTASISSQEEFDRFKLPLEGPQNNTNITKPHVQKPNPKSIPNSHLKQKKITDTAAKLLEKLEKPEIMTISKMPWYEDPSHIIYHLIDSIKNNNFSFFSHLMNKEMIPDTVEIDIFSINAYLSENNTLLHLAAMSPNPQFTRTLLYAGSNPQLRNSAGKVPYEVALDKDHRDVFRRYMASAPQQWDYKEAKVPSPLTQQMDEEQSRKRQEKKKAQRQAKAARQKARKSAETEEKKREEERLIAETQKLRMKELSARERCLLAAEARVAADQGLRGCVSGTCDSCSTGLDGLVPFERLEFKYCSVTCVREHRLTIQNN